MSHMQGSVPDTMLILLMALLTEGEAHTYRLFMLAGVSRNSAYTTMLRAENEGYVTSRFEYRLGQRGQLRRLYRLTDAGQKAIEGRVAFFRKVVASYDETTISEKHQ